MSSSVATSEPQARSQPGLPRAAPVALLLLAAIHLIVDTFACLVQPLWPALGQQLGGGRSTELSLYVLWTLAGSVSQLLFGFLGDKHHWRWLIWAGPLVSIPCMSAVGLVDSPWAAAGVLLLGGLGTAAFHPESATVAGECSPANRSRAMSIFYIGGYLGQAAGPYYGGWMADRYSLAGVAWGIPWGLALVAVLWLALRSRQPQRVAVRVQSPPLAEVLRGKYAAMGLVLLIGTLRLMVVMGAPLALAYLMEARGANKSEIGLAQSMLLAGIGAGAVMCALVVRPRRERLALWLPPLGVAPLVAFMPWISQPAVLVCMVAAGALLGVAIPVLASYGQQLLPRGQRIASSWTMGFSWGLGGTLGAILVLACHAIDRLELSFLVFGAAAILSSLHCFALPQVTGERPA